MVIPGGTRSGESTGLAIGQKLSETKNMTYWLNLFTGTTWKEFQAAGSKTAGFREHNWSRSKSIKPGDIFICYLIGVKRWVGLLEITSEGYRDESRIFEEDVAIAVHPHSQSGPA